MLNDTPEWLIQFVERNAVGNYVAQLHECDNKAVTIRLTSPSLIDLEALIFDLLPSCDEDRITELFDSLSTRMTLQPGLLNPREEGTSR